MSVMKPAILTNRLTKAYGTNLALDSLDIQVERGEIFGFLGPNGAGKSTAIRLLLDLIRPTSGSAQILGFDCQTQSQQARAVTGYLPGDFPISPKMTGRDTVHLFAGLRERAVDLTYAGEIADRLSLDLEKRAGAYSKGNRQKLGVLLALMPRAEILVLDEPTSGLDPLLQNTVWEILREEAKRGACVFFSSHVMSEVEATCERVGFLRNGRLIDVQPIAAMKARAVRRIEVTFAGHIPDNAFTNIGAKTISNHNETWTIEVAGEVDRLIKQIAAFEVLDLRTVQPGLEEILVSMYEE